MFAIKLHWKLKSSVSYWFSSTQPSVPVMDQLSCFADSNVSVLESFVAESLIPICRWKEKKFWFWWISSWTCWLDGEWNVPRCPKLKRDRNLFQRGGLVASMVKFKRSPGRLHGRLFNVWKYFSNAVWEAYSDRSSRASPESLADVLALVVCPRLLTDVYNRK